MDGPSKWKFVLFFHLHSLGPPPARTRPSAAQVIDEMRRFRNPILAKIAALPIDFVAADPLGKWKVYLNCLNINLINRPTKKTKRMFIIHPKYPIV